MKIKKINERFCQFYFKGPFVGFSVHWFAVTPNILGACFGVYLSKSISGGHINPAVTITRTILGNFPAQKLVPYILSQTLGAFISSCLVYSAYIDMELTEANAKIFATYPRDGVSIGQSLGTSIIGTCLMVHSIYGVNDEKNTSKPTSNLGWFTI